MSKSGNQTGGIPRNDSGTVSGTVSGDELEQGSIGTAPIALVGPHPPYRGGIAHFTERVSTALEETGRTVVRVSFSRMYPDFLFPGKSQYEAGSDDSRASQILDSINPASWKKAAHLILESGASTAVFMYWMPFFAPAYKGIIKRLKNRGVNIIGIVHNALPHEGHLGAASLSASFIHACDSILVLSESVKEDVRKLDPTASVTLHPHPTYDQFGKSLSKEDARAILDIAGDRSVLLFFGIVRQYKGLEVLLEAMGSVVSAVPDVLLVVAGEFYDEIGPYEAKIDEAGIGSNVHIVNEYIPSDEVRNYFCAADVVVQPYTAATQSGVIPVARHFGVPCIATDTGGLAEAVGDTGRVVSPGNPDELSAAILEQLSSRSSASPKPDPEAPPAPVKKLTWDSFVFALLEEEYKIESI